MNNILFEEVSSIINALDITTISEDRKKILHTLIDYIKAKLKDKNATRLNFICTHNSRRSHLSQIWAQTMAAFYNIENITAYSGGTEATALFPKVSETLTNQGFKINTISEGENPIYSIKYASNEPGIIAFSKKYNAIFNPESEFAAILTCSSADKGCPVVLGCDIRIPITYEDPKKSDGTLQQTETYLERSLQIATEMKYVFYSLK
ncbi:protein-tyrosine-phosphatase [Lacinutrix sp.]|uniref:protein-tyrosine-phosphatase n=1 Tax=Lacinutrix sp. TaxID=1937692 RepID=UPI0025B9722A|nr:protein-tyrosine-phosphatase [Lacinutrix sp.]